MGGRVFKNEDGSLVASRISKEMYKEIQRELTVNFYTTLVGKKSVEQPNRLLGSNCQFNPYSLNEDTGDKMTPFRFTSPAEFSDKEDYGDVDILYPTGIDIKSALQHIYPQWNQFKQNGDILHWLYKDKYQIDWIPVSEESFNAEYFYLSRTKGMLLGIIARHLGLSFGLHGFEMRDTGVCIRPLYLGHTVLPKEEYEKLVAKVFHINLNLFKQLEESGKKEDLFKLIWSSEFVNKDLFSESLASCKHRKREAQSPIYAEFMQWVDKQPEKGVSLYIPQTEVEKNNFYEEVFGKDTMDKVLKEHYYRLYMKEHKAKMYAEHFDSIKFLTYAFDLGYKRIFSAFPVGDVAFNGDIFDLSNYDIVIKKLYGKFREEFDVMKMCQIEIKRELEKFLSANIQLEER